MPHPVLLPDLAGLRAFAAASGLVQGVEQLHRATWHRPDEPGAAARETSRFSGARYRSWFHLSARATSLGYKVTGCDVVNRIRDAGRILTASVDIGNPFYEEEGMTGSLSWRDEERQPVPSAEVGPVAWSEGMRMAAALHAGRATASDSATDGAA
jgi:hypothetical protein